MSPLSALSGAAAKNATMVYFGGGSIASSGAGIKVGRVVLGGIHTAGAALAVAALYYGYKLMDETERRRYIEGRIALARVGCLA